MLYLFGKEGQKNGEYSGAGSNITERPEAVTAILSVSLSLAGLKLSGPDMNRNIQEYSDCVTMLHK
ncbi:hypothetical protein VEE48_06900 [Escherichia coli]|nr:hypothetical protein VEE48_06900 [Escherichia coli]